MDKHQDITKLEAISVRVPNNVDIQDHFVIEGTNGPAGAGALAEEIKWERRDLKLEQIQYAAKDAYICYIMYCRISSMRAHLTPAPPNRPPLRDNPIMPY
jgi:hypothetical protein